MSNFSLGDVVRRRSDKLGFSWGVYCCKAKMKLRQDLAVTGYAPTPGYVFVKNLKTGYTLKSPWKDTNFDLVRANKKKLLEDFL